MPFFRRYKWMSCTVFRFFCASQRAARISVSTSSFLRFLRRTRSSFDQRYFLFTPRSRCLKFKKQGERDFTFPPSTFSTFSAFWNFNLNFLNETQPKRYDSSQICSTFVKFVKRYREIRNFSRAHQSDRKSSECIIILYLVQRVVS